MRLLLLLGLAAALMAIATALYATHRREPEYVARYVEGDDGDGVQPWELPPFHPWPAIGTDTADRPAWLHDMQVWS